MVTWWGVTILVRVYDAPLIQVVGKTWNELRRMIMGERGSFVNLSFLRELQDERFRFDLDLMRGDSTPAEKVNRLNAPSREVTMTWPDPG